MALNLEDYYLPASLQEASTLLQRYGAGAMVVAGGTFVHGLEVRGLLTETVALVDISRLGLRGVSESGNGGISLKALTTLAEVGAAPLVRGNAAFGSIGDALQYPPRQILNVGTVGGCVAAAAPLYDLPAAFLALDGQVQTSLAGRQRAIPLNDFFVGLFESALQRGEIITAVELPAPAARTASAFLKLETNANDLSILNVAVRLTLDKDGKCADSRVILGGGVGETYVRATSAEAALRGQAAGEASFAAAAAAVVDDFEAVDDHRASAAYRRHIAQVYVRRTLATALARLG
ncbi:MAG: FAD binding domain-containing protein [Gammaproteobacteria bacterium]|nr:FAD binding domain-containing protein [Gammaproteobacteria bacterium]MCP5140063.1 FAD binding domain-containing protein [Chromatiales bacterium]